MPAKRSPQESQDPPPATPNPPQSTSPEEPNDVFPVVGIGASAGGIEAFTQLLSHLPIDTGMAFVLVQHLAPHQESMLSVILSRITRMPVTEVRDGMRVEPNHVYVIPPNAKMTIADGLLRLMPREQTRGQFMSVDAFFLSLAEDRGDKAIGVVLSGGDADGARGLEEIKAAGGITFAQSEDTAKVSGMPSTAAATGQVDFILPPRAIAEELANISRHPYVTRPAPARIVEEQPNGEDALTNIFNLLRTATGVDFTHYKQTTLKRRIVRRMALYKQERLEDYVRYLQDHPAEVMALYHDVLINVTSFFRDPESFEALKTQVFPVITRDKSPGAPIRIWVAGCSTGEEAYSIAICLLEFLADQVVKPPVQIYATDVSEMVINKARTGLYKRSQLGDVSLERLQRFFVPVEDSYQVCKAVREQCVFARQNLNGDPPFSRLDLITCRNVLIYLGASLQKKLLPTFHYGLKPTGFLMLGTSETVGDSTDLFELVDKKHKIYARKLVSSRLNLDLTASQYTLDPLSLHPAISEDAQSELNLQKEADRIVLQQFTPVGVIINADLEILQFRGQTSAYLEPAPGKASLNLLKMAKAELSLELRTMIHQAKKQEIPICKTGILLPEGDRTRYVKIDVVPFKASVTSRENHFLVLFEDTSSLPVNPVAQPSPSLSNELSDESEIAQLRQELARTKEHLQSIIEEQQATNQDLRAANEEILSSNEELQSTNEELETAKEEIQAANEELNTINDELHRRNLEANQVSNDLQNLLSSTNIPILMLDENLCIRRFTPLAQHLFNLIASDVGRPLRDINHNLNLSNLEDQILEVINTLNAKEQEVQDLQGHWYDLRIRPYRTIDNKIDGAVVILVDIDALKRSTQQLQDSRNYAEAIVETMRDPLVVLNSNLEVITANRAFYSMFQVRSGDTEQRLIFDLGNQQWNIPGLRSLLEAILPSTDAPEFQNLEVEHEFEQIGRKVMLLNAYRMSQVDQQDMILLSISDITDRKRLEAELNHSLTQEQAARTSAESANRAKDEFLSTLSHELRNPLNSLLGWVQLLRRPNLDPARMAHGIEVIERSARTQAQLIEDLLDISRITSDRLRLNLDLVQLTPIIEAAIEGLQVTAEAKQIDMQLTILNVGFDREQSSAAAATRQQPNPPTFTVHGDSMRLQQIIWNLLSNAIKFTPNGGRVEVRLEQVEEMGKITITDTGIGISPEFLPRIFERFEQADSSQTRSNTGLGLGLTIVRHLVELHNGTVEANSAGEGQGSTFIVKLPLQTNVTETAPAVPSELRFAQLASSDALESTVLPAGELPSIAGIRVLVVDDEADNREMIAMILEQNGAIATGVASAREALATLGADPGAYDLLLSDISMPERDGYDLIRQVRSLDAAAGGNIPAIALTALAGIENQIIAFAAGFQNHISKPIERYTLVRAIASLVGISSSPDS
jgi:two-component system CheB/CheR fusion protein